MVRRDQCVHASKVESLALLLVWWPWVRPPVLPDISPHFLQYFVPEPSQELRWGLGQHSFFFIPPLQVLGFIFLLPLSHSYCFCLLSSTFKVIGLSQAHWYHFAYSFSLEVVLDLNYNSVREINTCFLSCLTANPNVCYLWIFNARMLSVLNFFLLQFAEMKLKLFEEKGGWIFRAVNLLAFWCLGSFIDWLMDQLLYWGMNPVLHTAMQVLYPWAATSALLIISKIEN